MTRWVEKPESRFANNFFEDHEYGIVVPHKGDSEVVGGHDWLGREVHHDAFDLAGTRAHLWCPEKTNDQDRSLAAVVQADIHAVPLMFPLVTLEACYKKRLRAEGRLSTFHVYLEL